MSLKEGRKEGRRSLELASFVWKSPARARERGRNAPISSLHETGQQKLTIITRCGTGLVEERKVGFSWTASPLWDQTKVGPNQGGLFLDAIVGPDQTEGRVFLVTVSGTRPRWAFLGQLCGTRPRWAFLGQLCGTRPRWAFLGRPCGTGPDQTKTKPDAGEGRWAFLGRPCGTRPRRTGPDQTRPKVN
jgi:hypothetical protein